MVSIFMEIHDLSVLDKIRNEGAKVQTVTSSGIATVSVPVYKLQEIADMDEIGLMEASTAAHLSNDLSNEFHKYTDENLQEVSWGMNNSRSHSGKGVIVGIVDTGVDWTHEDFIDKDDNTRILYYWDQADYRDQRAPIFDDGTEYTYGREYTGTYIDLALRYFNNTWDPQIKDFPRGFYPINSTAQDVTGHGTHVAGTAAGNGRGSGREGVAFESHIIAVRWDHCGKRNSFSSIVDGVAYILKRAAELGLPAVVNLSLGSEMGPHDGSTLGERAINDLTGPGKVIVAAAGNSAKTNGGFEDLSSGFSKHGSGKIGNDLITIRIPNLLDILPDQQTCGSAGGYYVMFDIWYGGKDNCRVRITSPKGNRVTTKIGGRKKLEEGEVRISYGSSVDEEDSEIFIFIADIDGNPLAEGTWKIELIGSDSQVDKRYDAWHYASQSIQKGWSGESHPRDPTPKFGHNPSDNKMTIWSPASADRVISVGAYASRLEWDYYDRDSGNSSMRVQSYEDPPLNDIFNSFKVGDLAYFSSRGPRRDGKGKPDICGPGVGIASSFSHFVRRDQWHSDSRDSFFSLHRVSPDLEGVIFQGTSMSSPNVAGAVALLLQVDPTLDDGDLRVIFEKSALRDNTTATFEGYNPDRPVEDHVDSDPSAGSLRTFNNDWGFGKIDIDAALAIVLARCKSDSDCEDGDRCTLDACGDAFLRI